MHRRSLCLTLVSLVLFGGCGKAAAPDSAAPDASGGGSSGAAVERVRLQLNWVPEPEFGGIYAAELAGYFQAEGLAVEIIKGGPGVAAPQLAASGSVEFAVVSGEQVITLREQGGELVALYAIYQDDPMGVMVHASSPYQTAQQLWESNATVACESNLSWVKSLNKRYDGSKLRLVPHTHSVAEFVSDPTRAQQCFLFSEPVVLELQGISTRVFLSKESGFNPYNGVIVTNAAYAQSHAATCDKLVRALQRGWRAYIDDPSPTNEHMATLNTAMTKVAMDASARRQLPVIENDETKARGLGSMTTERWADTIKQLRELGTITSQPDPATLFRWSAAPVRQ